VRKGTVACVLLLWVSALGAGCSFFERQGAAAAEKTQPSRERLSEDTDQLVKQLQQKVDELQAQVKDLQHQLEGK
jgi:uncharacterized protein HemX